MYWIPLYELLERRGFEVMLVDARHVKGVHGRKSDVLDCQWLQQLLSYGLPPARHLQPATQGQQVGHEPRTVRMTQKNSMRINYLCCVS